MSDLSVVVPVLDEAAALPRLLGALAAQEGVALDVVVADGGSTDGSADLARRRGARVVESPAGRGRQMNAGAAAAKAPWLLFLHADSVPEHRDQLARALAAMRRQNGACAGHFPLRFARRQRGHALLYRYMEAKSATGRRYTVNGDQGLLIHRNWLRELGGLDESLSFLEDQRIAERIRDRGRWLLLPGRLITSARRFEAEGPRRRYLLMGAIMAAYATRLGAFFERAPDVYRVQAQTGRLLLTPYFRLLRRLLREQGVGTGLRRAHAIGAFAVRQSWQPFFALDVLLEPALSGRRPATGFHDRVFARLAHNRVGEAAATVLVLTAVFGVLAPWYRWRERRDLRPLSPIPLRTRPEQQPSQQADHRKDQNHQNPDDLDHRVGAASDHMHDRPDVRDQDQQADQTAYQFHSTLR